MKTQVYDYVTERIIELLEKGTIPWKKTWSQGKLAENFVSKKPYRGVNQFLLACSPFQSSLWLTYKQASALGGNVKKGEKSYMVIFWSILEKKAKDGTKENIPMLRYYNVFNVEQCEGLEIPVSSEELKPFNRIEACESVVRSMPKCPTIEHKERRAYYRPATDTVNMPFAESFDQPEHYYGVLFHELAHATGHESRLARKGVMESNSFGSQEYSKEELVAEMTSAFLSNHTQIEQVTIENSASYISSWLKVLKSDSKLVVQAAQQAQKASDYILNKIQTPLES